MKVSLNALRQLNERYGCAEDVTKVGVRELVEKIGSQLGAIEEITQLGPKYQGIVIARVVACEKHPQADKLSVCKIDDGGVVKDVKRDEQGRVQVVCGAPNVREGLTVVWLPPSTTVPETFTKDPLVLEVREIRGVKSNGMLASPKELALGDSHAGILEIDGDHKLGSNFAEAFKLADEIVLDIENKMFTHRPDCFGWLGINRELAGIQQLAFKSPDWYTPEPPRPPVEAETLPLHIQNELPELVPRFTAITMSDIKVGTSPVWLQVALAKVGQRSINNIVDLTNFIMLETGQPLHAYDYDKVKNLSNSEAIIVVRKPKPGEKVKLLNGKAIEPRPEAIMIATDKQLIGVGGVMGGTETEVDENTKNVIIECANFDMYSIRSTSMAHGLFTDAVTRFTKGQSPLQNLAVLLEMVKSVEHLASGKVASEVIDDNHVDPAVLERGSLHPAIALPASFINERLGLKLTAVDMQKLLQNVEFKVDVNDDQLTVQAPFWRTDIELREDVVEEVGRLYGYDHLPLELPQRSIEPVAKNSLLETKKQIRERLSKAGANEILTYSFVHGDLLQKTGQDAAMTYRLANALSPDLQYYRVSIMPSLLEKVHPNIKAGYDEFALFEFAKTHATDHVDKEGLPVAFELTGLVVTAADKLKKPGSAYYQACQYLTQLVGVPLDFQPISEGMQKYPIVQPYNLTRAARVNIKGGEFLGIIGEFKPSVARNLKLPRYTAGFEVDTEMLVKILGQRNLYLPLPRYPKVTQDVTLKVPNDVPYQQVFDFVWAQLSKTELGNTLPRLEPLDIYQADDDTVHKHLTFRLSIASYDRTLIDAEVSKLLDRIAAAAHKDLGAERI